MYAFYAKCFWLHVEGSFVDEVFRVHWTWLWCWWWSCCWYHMDTLEGSFDVGPKCSVVLSEDLLNICWYHSDSMHRMYVLIEHLIAMLFLLPCMWCFVVVVGFICFSRWLAFAFAMWWYDGTWYVSEDLIQVVRLHVIVFGMLENMESWCNATWWMSWNCGVERCVMSDVVCYGCHQGWFFCCSQVMLSNEEFTGPWWGFHA